MKKNYTSLGALIFHIKLALLILFIFLDDFTHAKPIKNRLKHNILAATY